MTKKPGNRAKQRRMERKASVSNLKPEDMDKLKDGLKKLGDNLKTMMEKRKEMDAAKEFSQHVEDVSAESYGMRGVLSKPAQQMVRGERIQWYWPAVNGISVIASYVTKDSVYRDDMEAPETWGNRHGTRAGQWVVDTVGPSGGALFQLPPEIAKTVADQMLSAVGWEFAWRDYYKDYIGEFEETGKEGEEGIIVQSAGEGSLNAEVIPIYNTKDMS